MAHRSNAFEALQASMSNMSVNQTRAHADGDSNPGSDDSSGTVRGGVPIAATPSVTKTSRFFGHNQDDNGSNSNSSPSVTVAEDHHHYDHHAHDQEDFGRRAGNGTPAYNRGGYRNSRTWMSPDTRHMQDFLVVRNAMRRLFKHSEVAKWKYGDYISHKEAMVASEKERLDRVLKAKEEDRQARLVQDPEQQAFIDLMSHHVVKGLHVEGNNSLVLGEKTIWCPDWMNGKEEVAPWPSFAEMKWEGDDRAKTSVGRFLPLPREMGAPGITWSQLQVVEQYPLDQVAKIPTMEDVYLPVDEIDDDVKYNLITKDLEDAMDAFLET